VSAQRWKGWLPKISKSDRNAVKGNVDSYKAEYSAPATLAQTNIWSVNCEGYGLPVEG